MAVDATTIYEFRATGGDANNGGGFANLNPGTSVDYSNQDAAQLTLTDCATSGIGATILTSATGGFTAEMEGSVFYLHTGTNLVDDYYQMTGYTDTNTITLDRAPDDGVGGVSGADCSVGGAIDILTDSFLENTNAVVPGVDIYVKKDGAQVLTGAISVTRDGTAAKPIRIIGYDDDRSVTEHQTDMPTITCAANAFTFDNYFHIHNFNIDTSVGCTAGLGTFFINCIINKSGGGGIAIFNDGGAGGAINCDLTCATGTGFHSTSSSIAASCYIHDSNKGIGYNSISNIVWNCVIDDCLIGIDCANRNYIKILQSTINSGSTAGITASSAAACVIMNNIIENCVKGADWSTDPTWSVILNYNLWGDGNTTDIDGTSVRWGNERVEGDPGIDDPAEDLSITVGSPAYNAGSNAGIGTGVEV